MTHICVGKLIIIGSDNGLLSDRRQAIIWTNAGILLIGPLGTDFSEILIEIVTFSFNKMHLKMSSGKWRPFCLGLNVLKNKLYMLGNLYLRHVWLFVCSTSHKICIFCGYIINCLWIYVIYLPISFRVASLALGQYDCPGASEETLQDVGKVDLYKKTQQTDNCDHNLWNVS